MLDILFPSETCDFAFFPGGPIPLALFPPILLLHEEVTPD